MLECRDCRKLSSGTGLLCTAEAHVHCAQTSGQKNKCDPKSSLCYTHQALCPGIILPPSGENKSLTFAKRHWSAGQVCFYLCPHAHFLLLTQNTLSAYSTLLRTKSLDALLSYFYTTAWDMPCGSGDMNKGLLYRVPEPELVSLERQERLFLYPPLSLGKSSRKTSEKETGLPKRGNTARYISKIKSPLQNLTQSLGGAFLGQVSILLVTQHSQGEARGAIGCTQGWLLAVGSGVSVLKESEHGLSRPTIRNLLLRLSSLENNNNCYVS